MNKSIDDNSNWTLVVRPRTGWFNIDFSELWRYRDLIILFVRRDFVSLYKQTVLGPLWFLLQPLLITLVYTIVFNSIANIPTDGLPPLLFYMSGTILWTFFANCIMQTSNTFIANSGMFNKVYFPRIIVPISVVISNFLTFVIQLGLFFLFMIFFYMRGSLFHPTTVVVLIPLLFFLIAVLGMSVGILISSITTKYRDVGFALTFMIPLWMYATPIVYPLSQIPDNWQWVFALNPMTGIVETFRYAFFGTGVMQPLFLGVSLCITTLLLAIGIGLFCRVEKTSMDTV